MKKKSILFTLASVAFGIILFTSCERNNNGGGTEEKTDLIGEVKENKTLKSGLTYHLTGGLHVKSGATLIIEEGVTIVAKDDNIVDYILIEQGAKIMAKGTASKPIIMTSERKEAGAWGGLHICGKAPINVTGATSKSEIGDATYGGSDAADNSGVIKYVRLEYTGYAFSEEKESNGLTLYGVGNKTEIDYVQAYKGSDDGFEWFGGTVNVKHLISSYSSDDSFDWTEGWCGKAQFLIAIQAPEAELGYECDCLIEADNNSKDAVAAPISHPILSNVTLIGNNSTKNKRGIRLRAGTEVELYNVLVMGKPDCLTTETAETENALKSGKSKLQYISMAGTISCKEKVYSEALFTATENNNLIKQTITFTDKFKGTISGGKDVKALDPFFVAAPYKGAVSATEDWTAGWSLK